MIYLRTIAPFSSAALLCCALALTACGDSGNSTGSTESSASSGSEGESSTTAGPGRSSSTGGTTPTGGESQTGGATDSGETATSGATSDATSVDTTGASDTSTTDATTSEDTTTGGVDDGCKAACENISSCDPDYPLEQCLQECAPPLDTPECLAAFDALNECIAQVSCNELMAEPCKAEVELYFKACEIDGGTSGDVCSIGGGGNPDLSECEFFVDCPGESFGMQCSGDKCACTYNGELGEMCELPEVCAGDKDPYDLMMECCGFELP